MSLFLPESAEAFLAENHVCTLTTIRPDGSPTWRRCASPGTPTPGRLGS